MQPNINTRQWLEDGRENRGQRESGREKNDPRREQIESGVEATRSAVDADMNPRASTASAFATRRVTTNAFGVETVHVAEPTPIQLATMLRDNERDWYKQREIATHMIRTRSYNSTDVEYIVKRKLVDFDLLPAGSARFMQTEDLVNQVSRMQAPLHNEMVQVLKERLDEVLAMKWVGMSKVHYEQSTNASGAKVERSIEYDMNPLAVVLRNRHGLFSEVIKGKEGKLAVELLKHNPVAVLTSPPVYTNPKFAPMLDKIVEKYVGPDSHFPGHFYYKGLTKGELSSICFEFRGNFPTPAVKKIISAYAAREGVDPQTGFHAYYESTGRGQGGKGLGIVGKKKRWRFK